EYIQESLLISRNNKLTALIYPDYELMDENKIKINEIETNLNKLKIEINNDLPSYKQISKLELFLTEFEKTPKKNIKRYLYQT
ncbi:MAG: long-chain fatty acid--CoA ligase, partial [Bacteroidales bacterium]|nr:long-chain fatty acid--CoA ligase [Bacteroidales bacterium]